MKVYVVIMPDGSEWGVPVGVIARNRATYYADEFGGDVERSMAEDTLPLFARHEEEIFDWAGNNMDWSDVKSVAYKIKDRDELQPEEMQEAWVHGERVIRDDPR